MYYSSHINRAAQEFSIFSTVSQTTHHRITCNAPPPPPSHRIENGVLICPAETSTSAPCRGKWRRVKGIGWIHASTLSSARPTANQNRARGFLEPRWKKYYKWNYLRVKGVQISRVSRGKRGPNHSFSCHNYSCVLRLENSSQSRDRIELCRYIT